MSAVENGDGRTGPLRPDRSVLSARAVQLRADYQNGVHELLAPETILWETCNGLIKAERQSILLPGQAPLFFLDFLSTQPASAGLLPWSSRRW